MSQLKTRLQALSLLDRALTAMTDTEMATLVASLPDDHRDALDRLAGAKEGGFTEPSSRILALRATAARGRMSGELEQISTVLTDPCLAAFIEALGDNSDNPTEEQFQEVIPAIIKDHGLATTRLTIASSIAGEAAASLMLTRVLKVDETLALPPADEPELVVLDAPTADEATKAKRRAAKDAKKADAAARRQQQLSARRRV